jgi:WD40 repeat protein
MHLSRVSSSTHHVFARTIKTNECVNTFDAHNDKIWAMAVNNADESTQIVTGSADSGMVTKIELVVLLLTLSLTMHSDSLLGGRDTTRERGSGSQSRGTNTEVFSGTRPCALLYH